VRPACFVPDALQGLALLSCNAKREEAEGQLRAAAVTESKLKRDMVVLKDEKKALVARVSQLEGEVADAQAALAAARAGDGCSACSVSRVTSFSS
jgi:hypothetical protein